MSHFNRTRAASPCWNIMSWCYCTTWLSAPWISSCLQAAEPSFGPGTISHREIIPRIIQPSNVKCCHIKYLVPNYLLLYLVVDPVNQLDDENHHAPNKGKWAPSASVQYRWPSLVEPDLATSYFLIEAKVIKGPAIPCIVASGDVSCVILNLQRKAIVMLLLSPYPRSTSTPIADAELGHVPSLWYFQLTCISNHAISFDRLWISCFLCKTRSR